MWVVLYASHQALNKYGNETFKVKRMGEIQSKPWQAACRQRYSSHKEGWEVVLSTKISEWEELVTDHTFEVFKNVQIGGQDKWKVLSTPFKRTYQ